MLAEFQKISQMQQQNLLQVWYITLYQNAEILGIGPELVQLPGRESLESRGARMLLLLRDRSLELLMEEAL